MAYARDLKNIEFNSYNTGHFALEEYPKKIADKTDLYLQKNLN